MRRNRTINLNKRQEKRYRQILWICLSITLLLLLDTGYRWIAQALPDHIILYTGQKEKLDLAMPFARITFDEQEAKESSVHVSKAVKKDGSIRCDLTGPIQMQAKETGSFQAEVRLFGVFHYKTIRFDVMDQARVMPVGRAVGLYVHAKGVMVLGTGVVEGKDGKERTPARQILQTGDYITAVDGTRVATIQDIAALIQKQKGEHTILSVTRGNNHFRIRIEPVLSQNGVYQIGAWLREDTEGIGTLTFVTEKNEFAALGHGITDADTGLLIRLQNGGLYPAMIDHVVYGEPGSPGELTGSVQLGEQKRLGTIGSNTQLGITGKITKKAWQYDASKAVALGRRQEVKEGKASIRCQLGDTVKEYEVEIEKIHPSSSDNKGMEIHVTDPALLKEAGGIIQGMSGAPLLQNGKCIGAVTHVFVKDVTRGYATFIENML